LSFPSPTSAHQTTHLSAIFCIVGLYQVLVKFLCHGNNHMFFSLNSKC
jgi:hypothetical protein